MFGFSFGLVMLGIMMTFPIIYLVGYGASYFDAWRFGKDLPKHKLKVNIVIALIIGVIAGGLVQHLWDNINNCMQSGNNFGQCFLMLNKK